MIQFWIEVISECITINNFQTALQIYTGLNLTPVQRLKPEWKDLSKKSKVRYQEIQSFFDPEMNYKRYRERMKKTGPPAIPLLNVLLRDLTTIEENEDKVDKGGEDLIHFSKMTLIHETVSVLKKFLHPGYLFPDQGTPELNKMCVQLPCLSENELYEFGKADDKKIVLQYQKDYKDAKDRAANATPKMK